MNSPRDRDDGEPDTSRSRMSDTHELGPAPSGRQSAGSLGPKWAVTLLDLSTKLRPADGVTAVVKQCVDGMAGLLPDCAIGVRMPRPARGDWLIDIRAPGETRVDERADAARLFPDYAHERVERVTEPFGPTLHVGSPNPDLLESGTPDSEIVEHCTAVLRMALQSAHAEELARNSRPEIEQLQARIIQGEKLASLGQIVANVVHELNNPLTSILAYAEYLRRAATEAGREEDEVERLRRIGEAAERAQKFARDLMDYAKPSTETPTAMALGDAIDQALSFCEHDFKTKQVKVTRDVPDDPPYVRGIAGHLVQVFVNLFANAAQAMGQGGGELRVTVRTRGTAAAIEVADTGVGIDAAALSKIFEPYFTTRDGDRGTGLGLVIVRDIITAHGGELHAHSKPGSGTTFSFTLPLATAP